MKLPNVAALLILAACGDPASDSPCYPTGLYEMTLEGDCADPSFAVPSTHLFVLLSDPFYVGPDVVGDFDFDEATCSFEQTYTLRAASTGEEVGFATVAGTSPTSESALVYEGTYYEENTSLPEPVACEVRLTLVP